MPKLILHHRCVHPASEIKNLMACPAFMTRLRRRALTHLADVLGDHHLKSHFCNDMHPDKVPGSVKPSEFHVPVDSEGGISLQAIKHPL
jgi:hypothetical protein